jgi:hypothetical protein
MTMTLAERYFDPLAPRVETWWPYLSIGAREAIIEHLDGALGRGVLREIRRVTGMDLAPGTKLTEDDRRFIRAQVEYD